MAQNIAFIGCISGTKYRIYLLSRQSHKLSIDHKEVRRRLVTSEEIERVAKLMKIEVTDHKEYVDKVHTMIDYFDILDSAGVEDEEIKMQEISISDLREDKHKPFEDKLIEKIKHYKGTYVRAPKMSS